ncbi:MAG: DUF5672 family protein [Myxococcota bacterium]|nr:DUF5672 family protein [Myxococcota bacterium]
MYLLNAHPFRSVQSKADHRAVCLSLLPDLRNRSLPQSTTSTSNETVIVEFRPLPHIEFLLRNTILHLPTWKHTIICGLENHALIQQTCASIPADVRIIALRYHNLTTPQYSDLLLTRSFWELLEGEKILLYQEDTLLFRGDIEPFLAYDYVGAPWPHKPFGLDLRVGNGGFSLRTRSVMLACLEQKDLELMMVTHYIPEDVYYSFMIQKHKLGLIPSVEIAKRFAEERVPGNNPLGGHQYWLANRLE